MSDLRQRGVTLVELMAVCVIMAILVLITAPMYRSYVLNAYRDAARAALGELLLDIERYRVAKANGTVSQPLLLDPLLRGSKASERYVFSLRPNPPLPDKDYRLVAVPIPTSLQTGNGALSLTSDGTGCWYKGNDAPENFACVGTALAW